MSLWPRRSVLSLLAASAGGCIAPGRRAGTAPDPRASNATAGRAAPDVDALIGRMNLDEKIGQMTQADLKALKPETDVKGMGLGSILSGGDSLPRPNTPERWADTYDRLQGQALDTRLGIPLLYGVDAVHGHNGLNGAVIFPHNIGLGCTRNPALVEQAARVTAREVAATGIDWAFAPCVAVPRDERWGRTYEGFGEDPDLVAALGAAVVRGLQGVVLGSEPTSVLACAKHFVGDGGTVGGHDQGDTQVTEAELRTIHLPGYVAAIRAGVGSVMVSYSHWNGLPMHANRHLISDVLKGELGFTGFVVSDWEAIDKLPGDYASDVETAINAGIDMVMVPNRYAEFIRTLRGLVAAGRVSQARIDDAVRRILTQKRALHLWERPFTDRTLLGEVGSDAHRAVARQAVRESMVLLKNDRGILPLKPGLKRIHMAGSRAHDLGAQCGGWSTSWQGHRGEITRGTTLFEGLKAVAGRPGARRPEITYDAEGAGATTADLVIAVVGEDPYAEFRGDRQNLQLNPTDLGLLQSLKATGRPLIVLLLSGRPLIIEDALELADAFVAIWLPGTEGAGVADVLWGDVKPAGKLSHSWPRTMKQIPINQGDAGYDPLFPFGFGLSF